MPEQSQPLPLPLNSVYVLEQGTEVHDHSASRQYPNLWIPVPPVPGQSALQSRGCQLENESAKRSQPLLFHSTVYMS